MRILGLGMSQRPDRGWEGIGMYTSGFPDLGKNDFSVDIKLKLS